MSMYPKDDRGEYRVMSDWIQAWNGSHGHPGYCLCELRCYADGSNQVVRGDLVYVNDKSCKHEVRALLAIFNAAADGLKENANGPK